MKAAEVGFSFIQDSMVLEVPFFQRSYVWAEDNWGELLENFLDGNQSHFVGSIILKNQSDTVTSAVEKNMIIDGQQRLTTMSILLKACYDSLCIKGEGLKARQVWISEQANKMKNSLLYKKEASSSEWNAKICHSHLDADDYNAVIRGCWTENYQDIICEDEQTREKPSNVLLCYHYFRNALTLVTPEELRYIWELLVDDTAKMMVKIDLDPDENEQTIFDTVNSTGVQLTSSDTIKNVIFQRAMESAGKDQSDRDAVIELYSDFWKATFLNDTECLEFWQKKTLARRLVRNNQEILLSAFAIIKGFFDSTSQKKSELPQVYKRYIKNFSIEALHSFVEEICRYADTFRDHFVGYDVTTSYIVGDGKLRLLHALYKFGIPAFEPYVLELLHVNNLKKKSVIPKEINEEFLQLESYIARHMACDVSIKSFDNECLSLLNNEKTLQDLFREKDEYINNDAIERSYRKYRVKLSKEQMRRVYPSFEK
jgi:uncharacterized protein with ParB-like and HNH nuclease domain